jgi:heptose-I-phosphate ethanolaminephosphotransferase
VLYLLLLALPCCLKLNPDGSFHMAKAWLATGTLSALLPATVLWLPACRIRWVNVLVSTILWILFTLDFALFFHFATRMSDRILFFIMQTNAREAGEFLSEYLLTAATGKAVIAAAVLAAFYLILRRLAPALPRRHAKAFALVLVLANVASAAEICFSTFTGAMRATFADNTLQGLWAACNEVGEYQADIKQLEKAIANCDGTIDRNIYAADHTPDVIFIIGESYNPNHAQVYGYPLPTTPKLAQERDNGNLLIFTDVATPCDATGKMMEIYYSPAKADAGAARWTMPLVPALFKHAGYAVTLHDNQCTRLSGDSKWDVGNCQFLNSDIVEKATLDYRNTEIRGYDMEFCQKELAELEHRRSSMAGKPLFAIFHLMGQHAPARAHYPQATFSRFSAADYTRRHDLNERQAAVVAEYDNATLYNDSVVASIMHSVANRDAIVIYVSDHGEEVHDFRDQYGRTMGPITRGIADNIYRVPLVVYTTPKFREAHAAITAQIQAAVNRKVYTADIGQMLLYLGGIATRWRDDSRNPLLDGYPSAGHRILINASVDFDTISGN